MDPFEFPPELRAKLQAYFDRMQTPEAKAGARALFGDGEMTEIKLSPEDRAAFLESLFTPPALDGAFKKVLERRAKLLCEGKPVTPELLEAVQKIRLAIDQVTPDSDEKALLVGKALLWAAEDGKIPPEFLESWVETFRARH